MAIFRRSHLHSLSSPVIESITELQDTRKSVFDIRTSFLESKQNFGAHTTGHDQQHRTVDPSAIRPTKLLKNLVGAQLVQCLKDVCEVSEELTFLIN